MKHSYRWIVAIGVPMILLGLVIDSHPTVGRGILLPFGVLMVTMLFPKVTIRVLRWSGQRLLKAARRVVSRIWLRARQHPDLTAVDLDSINWEEFEKLVSAVFEAREFTTELTKRTADQGIDVIAVSRNQRVGIQAKRYQGAVGNDAVMEAIAGSQFYNCNRTVVVCTSTFTKAAKELADRTGVELWDRSRLESELRWL